MKKFLNIDRRHRLEAITPSQKLTINPCPHCGRRGRFYRCVDCGSIEFICDCRNFFDTSKELTPELEKTIQNVWNNQALSEKWFEKAKEIHGVDNGTWFFVDYETMAILSVGTLRELYDFYEKIDAIPEIAHKPYCFFKMVNNTLILMSPNEIGAELQSEQYE